MSQLIDDKHYDRPLYFYEVGDRVHYNYGPEAAGALEGTVLAVDPKPAGQHGEPESQRLTVDWTTPGGAPVTETIEYPQDLEPA